MSSLKAPSVWDSHLLVLGIIFCAVDTLQFISSLSQTVNVTLILRGCEGLNGKEDSDSTLPNKADVVLETNWDQRHFIFGSEWSHAETD